MGAGILDLLATLTSFFDGQNGAVRVKVDVFMTGDSSTDSSSSNDVLVSLTIVDGKLLVSDVEPCFVVRGSSTSFNSSNSSC